MNPGRAVKETTPAKSFAPEWAKKVVWYQILPERFRNGDPTNDPTKADILGADPQEPPRAWQVHPWGSDWYRLQPYEQQNGVQPWWKHALRRRYGGDLQGIIDKLDYLEDLGITAIYLNPVFDAPSLHKYDGASYHHIDPTFGPDPAGDRQLIAEENPLDPATWVWTAADELALALIREVHARGMRIIFDGVFNHMGINSFAFRDVVENQQASPCKDWFEILAWDDPATGEGFDYRCWWVVKSLPELRDDGTGMAPGPKEYIFRATERWMNPKGRGTEHGIDGWRLDVAFEIDHTFWKDWRRHVRSINPEAYLTAELVKPPEVVVPYMQGDEFDGEMNYNFAFACAEFFFNPGAQRITATAFDEKLRLLRTLYPEEVAYVSQNLFGSHDSDRLGSHIVNRGIGSYRDWNNYHPLSKAAENPAYQVRKPNDAEIRLQKLFVIMQMTYVGAPMIYYGDEVGMWGANDPDCRKPMVWDDLAYEDETHNPDGTTRPPDTVAVNHDLRSHYKKLIAIRNAHPALQTGSYRTLIANDANGVFAFERVEGDERIVVVLNNASTSITVTLPDMPAPRYRDLLQGETFVSKDSTLTVKIPHQWGVVLLSVQECA